MCRLGYWGVDRTDGSFFAVEVQNRNMGTCEMVIRNHIRPGSKI